MIIIFQIKHKIFIQIGNEGVVVEKVVEDVGVIMTDMTIKIFIQIGNKGVVVEKVVEDVGVLMTYMTIITDHTITNMKEVVEDTEETGGATGGRVEVTEATVDGMGIGVVVEAEVDTKMGACSK